MLLTLKQMDHAALPFLTKRHLVLVVNMEQYST